MEGNCPCSLASGLVNRDSSDVVQVTQTFGALMFPVEHHDVCSKSWLGGHLLQRLYDVLGQGESSLVNRRIVVASL